MKKILISGGNGFLGHVLTKYFCRLGYKVAVIVRSNSDLSRLDTVLDEIKIFRIDEISAMKIIQSFKPNIVIHTAVTYGKTESIYEVFQTNLIFFIDIINASLLNGVSHFINTDTFSKKRNYDYLKAYHLSKRHSLDWARLLIESSNTKFSNMVLEQMYGPRDRSDKFVSFIINSLNSNQPKLDLTHGRQKRDFVFIEDVAAAYQTVILNQEEQFEEYEVGTGTGTSIREFVELVKKISNNTITVLNFGKIPIRSGEFQESIADTAKLNELGWFPKIQFFEGINIILNEVNS